MMQNSQNFSSSIIPNFPMKYALSWVQLVILTTLTKLDKRFDESIYQHTNIYRYIGNKLHNGFTKEINIVTVSFTLRVHDKIEA